MGLDNYTRTVYGWKIVGRKKVKEFENELEKINENYYDDYIDFFIDDYMCGEYIYFGAKLVRYDADEGGEVIINNELIKKKTDEYHKFLKDHPELDKFLQTQIGINTTSKEPQLYVFQQIW